MLDSRTNRPTVETKVVSIIGQGTSIQGDIRSEGTIRIEGKIAGRIQCGDTIVVQESGQVKADMVANQVVISGEVHGNVFAHERLEITPTGKVVGDITAPRISISEGVLFEGKCTMKPPGQMKTPNFDEGGAAAGPAQQQLPQHDGGRGGNGGDGKDPKPESTPKPG